MLKSPLAWKKSSLPPVVAAVTNISYGISISVLVLVSEIHFLLLTRPTVLPVLRFGLID